MDEPALTSFSLTHVYYDSADILSYISAWLALVPQALTVIYVAVIWSTREMEILLMFAGQMGCETLNFILKKYFQEERPTTLRGKGYGMPSSHAQYVAFFSTSLSLFLLIRHQPHNANHAQASSTHIPIPYWQRLAISVLSLVCAGAVAQSRIYLNYHHPRQVWVGIAAGVVCALGWFVLTSFARKYGLVDQLLDTPLARWTRMRDLVVNEDLVDAGFERWLRRREAKGAGGVGVMNGKKKKK